MSFITQLFGDPNKKIIEVLKKQVALINACEDHFSRATNDELREQTVRFKHMLVDGATLDDILPEAFAVCREAAHRFLKQRHYDVQLMGGIVMHRGQIAEMRTGEGKTLTATLALYLNALSGKGAHLVTVNDYLAKRDAVWMSNVYHALGLTVGCIQHEAAFLYDPEYQPEKAGDEHIETESFKIEYAFLRPCTRKEAYAADITYGTNNEFGFDYLRDNLAAEKDHAVQRELNFAIVDEVDSILIDEARTPLIISAPAEESADLYYTFANLVAGLIEKDDYVVDEKMRATTLTEQGLKKMEEWLGMGNVYTAANITTIHHIEQALKARALFKRDRDYVVKDNEVIIVDEFTGRLMHGRRYSEGLHQAIEAQERVPIQRESRTHATITFQNLFRLYAKLSGMTGTAATEAEEFSKIYNLEVVTIPTNKDTIRKDLADRVYKNERGKFKAVVDEIRTRHTAGQPVLVGTISIEKNEYLSKLLEREGVEHQLLNAKNHEREAEIIAQAGRKGAVTIATNMAGRGVDIILGGNPPNPQEASEVRAVGGLFVLGTERHESRRIDNQLRGRSGRQGDEGATQFYISMEDDLMRIFGSERMKDMMERLGIPEDMPIENKLVSRSLEEAQKKVEGHNFDTRKHLVEYDDILNKQREIIYRKRREVLEEYEREIAVLDRQRRNVGEEESEEKKESHAALKAMILKMIEDEIEHIVSVHTNDVNEEKEWDTRAIYDVAHTIFSIPLEERTTPPEVTGMRKGDKLSAAHARTALIQHLLQLSHAAYEHFERQITEQLEKVFPGVDASSALRRLEKDLLLRSIDTLWIEHLDAIEHLRAGIGLRGYGQRDPLVEYKRESYRLFSELVAMINKQVVYSIFKIGMASQAMSEQPPHEQQKFVYTAPEKTEDDNSSSTSQSSGAKVGRNEPCPCGSGKKYKRCHGA